MNDKVVEFIFFTDNPGKEELRREEKKLETDLISKNNLLRGTAFYKGKVVAEEEKTGFTNKGQLVALLVKRLPKDIPTGAIVQFVIENMDKGGKWMYEHHHVTPSMTESSNPKDNAMAERVNNTVKNELLYGKTFTSLRQVKIAVDQAILFYNGERPHSSIDWHTPDQAHQMEGELKRHWHSWREDAIKNRTIMTL